jgi:Bacteriophage tail sheath protein
MVLTYRRPGVYLEESLLVNPAADVASTLTVGCFVGVAQKGPGNLPQLIESWSAYVAIFGGFGLITPPPRDPNDITTAALEGRTFTDLAELKADDLLGDGVYETSGNPSFTAGQYVILDDNTKNHYAVPPDPNNVTQATLGSTVYPDLATLKADPTVGDTHYSGPAFTAGQYAVLGDGSKAHTPDTGASSVWAVGPMAGTGATVPPGAWAAGPMTGTGAALEQDPDILSYLPYTVYSFFQNGGRFAWVVRSVPTQGSKKGKPAAKAVNGDNTGAADLQAFRINALSAGTWGNNIAYRLVTQDTVGVDPNNQNVFALQVLLRNPDDQLEIVETFTSLSMSGEIAGTRKVSTAINDPNSQAGSRYIYITDVNTQQPRPVANTDEAIFLADGVDPAVPSAADMKATASVITQVEGPINLNISGYLANAAKEGTAFAEWTSTWLDPKQTFPEREDIVYFNDSVDPRLIDQTASSYFEDMVDDLGQGANSYIAGYGPWILVPDPQRLGNTLAIPPAGAVIGTAARIDATMGVFRAPAGVVASIANAVGVQTKFTDAQLGDLNALNINIIRSVVGAGICIMGARTRKTYGVDKYLSARRTLISIKESLRRSTQWAVFENNDDRLWSGLRTTADRILRPLWEAGGLRGSTTDQAYYIRCDETLNTASVIQSGEVRMEIGVALQYPAEFVVIKITQYDSGVFTSEVQPLL